MITKKTIIEQTSYSVIIENCLNKIDICFNSRSISNDVWKMMERVFQTKSKKNITKEVFTFLSGAEINPEKRFDDQLKYDHISNILNALQHKISNDESIKDIVEVKIPRWQILLVASSMKKCIPANEFVESIVNTAYKRLSQSFFGGSF